MSETECWLSIIGIGEDRREALPPASLAALAHADHVFGAPRHLALADLDEDPRAQVWPVPFSVKPVLALRGKRVAVLASGDPFWFGAGASLAVHLSPSEWRAFPAPSTFSLAAARLGWRIEETACLGLHAAPFERLVPVMAQGARAICLLRDGAAADALADWLTAQGFGDSTCHVLEALGGLDERIRTRRADAAPLDDVRAPVAMAVAFAGNAGLPRASGLPDTLFTHDGQITKRPVRALTLSALAPRAGEVLWDLGAGSGSIAIEWCLAGGRAIAVERHPERVETIRANAARFGLSHKIEVIAADTAQLPDLPSPALPSPDAVFIGGGANEALIARLWAMLPAGTRIVVNAVTLETEAVLIAAHARHGGDLLRIDLAHARPLGRMQGWEPVRPVVQWSVTR
ncbi:precorrin-6Y C5,15-methyltransferase (decarboxylating), CbiT subunit [Novosphingobium nitrogenifigens DSM 19370]|uniref:Precorrin-6Y C5,15-methyltransferase (Decarboxylating), CbiT subunit n=1 Tax=Novosphingobium nitrogenifigens DSM 19370 TaxID=983920 RepID=F1Z377_9SPHN|nr:bifunctional cobalt-precorrin-7 (C(5))-methyltransferase/cobalt-precorrin-6B (C(15))-methyltransferase [Novosphingobium nitrogenifigens]EGD60936.1 precorrin-6Y C5,15-methyltransferase (decarboxylating), CbiT subunit [Novosphingobium nitrogenifigens DSM 19370]